MSTMDVKHSGPVDQPRADFKLRVARLVGSSLLLTRSVSPVEILYAHRSSAKPIDGGPIEAATLQAQHQVASETEVAAPLSSIDRNAMPERNQRKHREQQGLSARSTSPHLSSAGTDAADIAARPSAARAGTQYLQGSGGVAPRKYGRDWRYRRRAELQRALLGLPHPNADPQDFIGFAHSWLPYGGAPDEDIFEKFGMTRTRFIERLWHTIRESHADPRLSASLAAVYRPPGTG